MRYAVVGGVRSLPRRGVRGSCPCCGSPVIPKMGEVVVHHWAHESVEDCDPWYEGISAWHLAWQSLAPPARREVVIGRHRADVVSRDGVVVELQRSPISPAEIRERERFYRRIIWIFDASEYKCRIHMSKLDSYTFVWEWERARPSLLGCRAPAYHDFGDGRLFRLDRPSPVSGGVSRGVASLVPAADIEEFYFK